MSEPRYPFVHVDVHLDDAETVASALWDLGADGVEERDQSTLEKAAEGRVILVGSFATDADAEEALAAFQEIGLTAHIEVVVGDAWRDEWRKYFKPTRIGERVVVRPSWEPYDAEPNDVVVTIDPGRAFGSGLHETTRLVLRALDAHMPAGVRVLDVGCGSGILAVAAVKLGATSAVAIDNDPEAAEVTIENALSNDVPSKIEASTDDVGALTETFPFVVANIEARVLVPLADPIAARVAPAGQLVLSGILRGQEEDVLAAYPGFSTEALAYDGEWVSIRLRRDG